MLSPFSREYTGHQWPLCTSQILTNIMKFKLPHFTLTGINQHLCCNHTCLSVSSTGWLQIKQTHKKSNQTLQESQLTNTTGIYGSFLEFTINNTLLFLILCYSSFMSVWFTWELYVCTDGNIYIHVVFKEPVVKHLPTHSRSNFKSNFRNSGETGLHGQASN